MAQLAGHIKPSVVSADKSADLALESVPPLQSGDRLTRVEFERRYNAAPDIRAELVEGVVYVSSPVSAGFHGRQHFVLISILGVYQFATPGLDGLDNATVRLDNDNEPQPDITLKRTQGGNAVIEEDGIVAGAPEWVAEIAASSASYDLHDKFRAYRRNGIKEYVIWRTLDKTVDYFILRNGAYQPASIDADGVVKSEVFPGLWLNVKALAVGENAVALQTMQAGIASPEHAAFVQSLTAAL